jgi:hypothetical protein
VFGRSRPYKHKPEQWSFARARIEDDERLITARGEHPRSFSQHVATEVADRPRDLVAMVVLVRLIRADIVADKVGAIAALV